MSRTSNPGTIRELPIYVSIEQAAGLMSMSTKTIRRRISDGTIPAYQCVGGPSASAWKPRSGPASHPVRTLVTLTLGHV
jgi:excisionase family DNA binding protein